MNKTTQHSAMLPTRFTLKPLLMAIPLSVLAACANNQPQIEAGPDLTSPVSIEEKSLDATPIIQVSETDDSLESNDSLDDNTHKGDDPMTVLVIENPEILSKLASENLKPVIPMPSNSAVESLHRPGKRVFHFGFNQTALSDEDIALIEQHAEYLKANPELQVTIHGHTDAQGNPDYNLTLSQQRAAMMLSQLLKQGISKDRIKTIGWGGGYPLVSSLNFAENRRIEIEYSEIHYAANQ